MFRAKIVLRLLVVCAAALVVSPLSAQIIPRPWYGGYGWGGGYGFGGYGGGTAAGNYMQGMSTVIRSAGEYNLLSSEAGINNEEMRSKYLDNRKKWTQNYFQLREERMQLEAQKREMTRHSADTVAASAKSAAPRPLSSSALDPVTGQITWPELLRGDEFAPQRTELEKLFELRAKTGQGEATTVKIHTATEEMSKILRKQIEKTPANEYMAARKFLDGLDRAARA